MLRIGCSAIVVGAAIALIGCGRTAHPQEKVDAGPCTGPVPTNHVPTPVACPTTRAPSNPTHGQPGECLVDTDCTAGTNGRCIISTDMDRLLCSYDECFTDADCSDGGVGVCGCRDPTDYNGNICLAANCLSDADCGACGYCSPVTGGCGTNIGVVGYYCHTPQDECLNDSDCDKAVSGLFCIFDPVKEMRWICAPADCTG